MCFFSRKIQPYVDAEYRLYIPRRLLLGAALCFSLWMFFLICFSQNYFLIVTVPLLAFWLQDFIGFLKAWGKFGYARVFPLLWVMLFALLAVFCRKQVTDFILHCIRSLFFS